MAQENGNIEAIVEQIVCTSLLGDKEYQNTDDKSKRKYLYDQQTEMVNESIDQMCKLIEAKLPKDVSLPIGLRVEVANQMLVEVMQNPSAVTTGFKLDEKSVMKSLNLLITDEDRYEEPKREYIYQEVKGEESAEVIKLKEISQKISDTRIKIQENLFEKAWGQDGTKESKDAYSAQSRFHRIELLLKNGKTLNDLNEEDRLFFFASLRQTAEEQGLESIREIMADLKITEDMIFEEAKNYKNETMAKDEITAIEENKINEEANKFLSYIECDEDDFEKASKEYRSNLDNSEYPVDALLEALMLTVENARLEREQKGEGPILKLEDNPRAAQVLQDLRDFLLDEEKKFICDNYTSGAVLLTAYGLHEDNPEEAKKLIEAYNKRLREQGFEEISYEKFLANRELRDSDGNLKITHIQIAACHEKYGEEGNLEEFIKDFNNGEIHTSSAKEITDEGIIYSKEDIEILKNAKRNDFLEMYKKFGLEYALKLGSEGMDPQIETEKRTEIWSNLLEEECKFDNVLNGKSIIKIEDAEILDKFLPTEQQEIKTEKQKRYYENLNRLSKQLKITKEKRDNGLLSALELGYESLIAEETSKEDKEMWYQIMMGVCDPQNGIVEINDIEVIERHLQDITKGNHDDLQRNYILNLSNQLKILREERKKSKVISADNVLTGEVVKGIASQVNLIDNSRYSSVSIKQPHYLYDRGTGKSIIEINHNEQENPKNKQDDEAR